MRADRESPADGDATECPNVRMSECPRRPFRPSASRAPGRGRRHARTRDRSFEMRARASFESSSPASSPASFARGSRASRAMRRASSSRASSSSSSSSLFELVDASRRGVGVAPNDDARRDIERAIDALASTTRAKGDDARSNNAKSYARWELAYTTEKETLWLLGLKTRSKTRAFQTLREDAKTLSNEVVFNDGEVVFKVDAVVEESSRATMKFRFTAASLTFRDKFSIPIPPVGSGWFENVYVDDERRVSRDSRGDTLICVKVK